MHLKHLQEAVDFLRLSVILAGIPTMVKTGYFTERLSLRLVAESDHEFVKDLVNSEGWLAFIGDRNVHSDEDARNYIRKILATPAFFYWVVRLRQEQTPIGIVSFIKRSYLDHFDIGFALLPGFEGKGYAFEATEVVLADVLKQEHYATVLATCLPGNVKSIKLLQRLGFVFSKELRMEDTMLDLYGVSFPKC